jgi:hypothetical protein
MRSSVMSRSKLKKQMLALVESMPKKPPIADDASWAAPDPEAFTAFYELLYEFVRFYWGVDCDSDSAVILSLCDRTRYENDSFSPVPHPIEEDRRHRFHKDNWGDESKHTPEENEARHLAILSSKRWIARMIGLNFSLANARVVRFMQEQEHEIDQEMRRPARDRAAGIKHLEYVKTIWSDPAKWAQERGYQYDDTEQKIFDPKHLDRKATYKPQDYYELMVELDRLKAYKELVPPFSDGF